MMLCLVSCVGDKNNQQSVTFDSIAVDTVCPLFTSCDKPACHLTVKMEVPAADTDEELGLAIERFISMLPKDGAFDETSDGRVETMINAYMRSYVMQYLSEGPNAIDSYGGNMEAAATWMSYEENVEGKALYNDDGMLSYQVRVVSYTGGAHDNTKTYNGVFHLEDRETLSLASFFEYETLEDLNEMLRLRLAKQYGCESVEELESKQIFFAPAEIEATENFYVDDTSINWTFDPFDIAPYSTGVVVISLTWDEVSALLKKDAPFYASK